MVKGVVFNLLESFICEGWGEDTYEGILDMCPMHARGPHVGPGTYPDADLMAIAGAASAHLGLSLPDALRAFGRYSFPHLAAQVPGLMDTFDDARTFLQNIDGVIHVEVHKLMPEAVTPRIQVEPIGSHRARLHYHSRRRLCAFMEGLLSGTGDYFGSVIDFEHTACMHSGAPHCEYELVFTPVAAAAVAP